jgi:uncharacterized protein (TIGR00369 family)
VSERPPGLRKPLATVHLYDHCAMRSRLVSEDVAEGEMPICPDICTPAGVRASLVGLLMELVTGRFALSLGTLVLSDMTLHLRDAALDVDAVRAEVRIVRRGRSRVIGLGRLEAARAPQRLIGLGTVSIAVLGGMDPMIRAALERADQPQPLRPRAPDFAGGPVPDILEVMAMSIGERDQSCWLERVHPGVVGPQDRLHGGAQQMLAEAAALAAAERALGTRAVVTGELSIRFLRPALAGPFEAVPRLVSRGADDALLQVELVDHGNADRLVSLATCRVRAVH